MRMRAKLVQQQVEVVERQTYLVGPSPAAAAINHLAVWE